MTYNGYLYRNSVIHRMNPSLKFITTILFIAMIFIPYGFFFQIILFVLIIGIYFLAKLPMRKLFKICQSVLFMMFVLLIINWVAYKGPGVVFDFGNQADLLYKPSWLAQSNNVFAHNGKYFLQGYMFGGTPISNIFLGSSMSPNAGLIINNSSNGFHIWENWNSAGANGADTILNEISKYADAYEKAHGVSISFDYKIIPVSSGNYQVYAYFYQTQWYSFSSNAIMLMLYVTMKIFLMILIVTILTSTTSSIQLTYALEDILNPLRIFKLPINEWSTTIALAIRFIPSLLDESNKIMNAQASRGLDFTNGNLKEKIYSLSSLIVPLFSIAFRKADELANAMEARGYNPRFTRTRYRDFKIYIIDWIVFSFVSLLLGLLIVLATFNGKSVFFSPLGLLEAIIMFN
ncbi:MAG: energy-coupling factor transporter transmembrane component T [Malacoplasma sp.]